MAYDFDLFTIGGGSGGVRAARMAAGFGAKVALAEEARLGGTCVNVGCVPKKLFVYASHFAHDFADARAYGWQVEAGRFDWSHFIRIKDHEIERLNGIYARLLDNVGVTRIAGRARLVDAHTVEVDGKRHTAEHILIAVGGRPRPPLIPGAEHAIISDAVFALPEMPKRIVVVGGGYIGVEFACIFAGLGAEVTQVHRGDMFLRGFDDDIRRALADQMRSRGIELRFDTHVSKLTKSATGVVATLSDGSHLTADQVLFAIGRVPYTEDLGLEEVGVETDEGAIVVDSLSRTTVDNIYAVGDVTDRIALTPVALAEGMAVARTLYGGQTSEPDHMDVPSAVFSQPAIGTVGLTEEDARNRFGDITIYRSSFRPLKHTLSGRDERSMLKLVVETATDRVVGVHVLDDDAGEIVQGFAVAIKMGATKADLDRTIGIHPTAAEELVTMRTPVS